MSLRDSFLKKIQQAEFISYPFKHLYIPDFFDQQDFLKIITSDSILLPPASHDEQLFALLKQAGYNDIVFPNCTNLKTYIERRKTNAPVPDDHIWKDLIESTGVVLRLENPVDSILAELNSFLKSSEFQELMCRKFDLDIGNVFFDSGIQKYFDGYQIAPHCDTRLKALTYMININTDPDSENQKYHTHYMTLNTNYKYVQAYWDGNPRRERTHVPWDWCTTNTVQSKNNSLVMFAPGNSSLHAVKAEYNHLTHQRTQIYGNVWHRNQNLINGPNWKDFDFESRLNTVRPAVNLRDSSLDRNMI